MPETLVADERRARAGPGHPIQRAACALPWSHLRRPAQGLLVCVSQRKARGGLAICWPRRAPCIALAAGRARTQPDASGCPPFRLSENLTVRRSVSSGSSVWLSDGGGLTLFSPVGFRV